MNSFQSLTKFIQNFSVTVLVLGFVAFIVLFPFIVAIFALAVVWAIVSHHNRTCQHFRPAVEQHTRHGARPRRRSSRAFEGKREAPKREQGTSSPHEEVVHLSNGTTFDNAEARIREYCDIEVYRGYDDRHTIDDRITMDDVESANRLFAMIDRYDSTESSRIVGAAQLESALTEVPDADLACLDHATWLELEPKVRALLDQFLSIRGVGLAKATKILHLKRPHLFPVLDSFVAKFLSGQGVVAVGKGRLVEVGLSIMEMVREDLQRNGSQFLRLQERLAGLPIQLTPVRMHDILCWSQEKWVVRGNTHAEYGTATRSI
ncbi:MAG: DUF6308 family protein [Nitrososphaerales archaeon]|nr:DUF6308 family protein [Nitrososphaerales archaeon]